VDVIFVNLEGMGSEQAGWRKHQMQTSSAMTSILPIRWFLAGDVV
jgi:hypothetical protein